MTNQVGPQGHGSLVRGLVNGCLLGLALAAGIGLVAVGMLALLPDALLGWAR